MKDKVGKCRHPDCIYRNRADPKQSGGCSYWLMTGHCRIAGLKPREQDPSNCPRYISDGSSRKTRAAGKEWHAEAERLYNAGYTDHEIADAVGVSYNSVQHWRRHILGKDPNPDRGKAQFPWEWARDLYLAGLNDREIAEKLGCCVSSVYRWRSKYELFPNGKVGSRKKKETEGGIFDEAQGTGKPVQ